MEYQVKELCKQYYPFWEHLNEDEKAEFSSSSKIHSYEKGNAVHDESHHCLGVFLVLNGHVRVYIQSDEGREITLFRLSAGEVCTLSAGCMMEEISFDILIETVEESTLLITGPLCLHRLMAQNLYLENYIYKQLAERFSDVMWAISQILFKSFDKRLAGYLMDEKNSRKSLAIQSTHDEIARDLGSAREVVSRMLKYFEKEGIVSLSRGTVRITNEEKLKTLAL